MTKEELLDEIEGRLDDEINIINLQSEHFNEDLLKTLWNIKKMVEELES